MSQQKKRGISKASLLVGCFTRDRRMTEEYNEAQLRLIKVWDAHCKAEFADASVEDTMATMIQESESGTVPFVKSCSNNDWRLHSIFNRIVLRQVLSAANAKRY
jgi:hypothetical protein